METLQDRLPVIYPMGGNADEKRLAKGIMTSPEWVVERKYDGQRYLLIHDFDGSIRLTSRQKSEKTGLPVDKAANVPHLVELAKMTPRGTVLDGEIITHVNCHSSEVTEIMGCDADKAISRQKERGFVKYVVYDILYVGGQNLTDEPWVKRRLHLEKVVEKYIGLERGDVILSAYFHCDKFDAQAWYEEIVKGGGEGVMLKNIKAKYKVSDEKMQKPAGVWVKVKKWLTEDCVIMGFLQPTEIYTGKESESPDGVWMFWEDAYDGTRFLNEEGLTNAQIQAKFAPRKMNAVTKPWFMEWIGSVVFGQYDKKGKLIEVGSCSGMTEEVREWLSVHQKEAKGLVIEVQAMERIAKTKALRHPEFERFRYDKRPEECVIS